MNTPSHYIVNLALLGNAPNTNTAITIGAILPDLPIFVFYTVAKLIYQLPEHQIWSEAYYEPLWQNLVALFHSIPLALIGLSLCLYYSWKPGALFCLSLVLHSLLDLPVHNDDAHRHFFPFSDYRLISPFSYWDPQHYGNWVATVELLLVLALTPVVFKRLHSWLAKGVVVVINVFYALSFIRIYLL